MVTLRKAIKITNVLMIKIYCGFFFLLFIPKIELYTFNVIVQRAFILDKQKI